MSVATAKRTKFAFSVKGNSASLGVLELALDERLSALYQAELTLVCEDSLALDSVLGKEGLLTISGDGGDRLLQGLINRFAYKGEKGRFHLYEARLVPQWWLASQRQDNRLFQNQNVRDTVGQVLKGDGLPADRYAFRLQDSPAAKDFCVQYEESDFAFVSRLLERDGIWYSFEHSRDKHVVTFTDTKSSYKPIDGDHALAYKQGGGMVPQEEIVYEFSSAKAIGSGKVTQTDFNPDSPSIPLSTNEQAKSNAALEIYEFPGGYMDATAGQKLTKIRLQESTAMQDSATGASTSPRLTPGRTFTLKGHEVQAFNREYLVVSVTHAGRQPQVLEEKSGDDKMSYHNTFTVIPSDTVFRPPRVTPRPVMRGPQTALVVGPQGQEIYTDSQGRVKVKFHWDRLGSGDEKSSCWIRVGQSWAGGGWGAIFLPRVGNEVIVSFLEGDPDRPLIVGSVYNGANTPPHALPDNKTKTTIMSQSSPQSSGHNELSFEDAQGKEEIFLQGQKDLTIKVTHDKNENVGNNESRTISKNQTTIIGGDASNTVAGTKSESVARTSTENVALAKNTNVGAAYTINVGAAHTVSVGGALNTGVGLVHADQVGLSRNTVVGQNLSVRVLKDCSQNVSGDTELKTGKKFTLEAGDSFEINCGQSQFKMESDGTITLSGTQITIEASGPVQVTGEHVDIN